MRNRAHENLVELLRRFMDEATAQAAHKEIQTGERWLEVFKTPMPDARLLAAIKTQMAARAVRRHRIRHLIQASLSAAAAVIVLALAGLLGPEAGRRPHLSYASIIPTALWESDDITTDDLNLAYFSSEIRQIEAQMQALDADESDGSQIPDELEIELMTIGAEFWKG